MKTRRRFYVSLLAVALALAVTFGLLTLARLPGTSPSSSAPPLWLFVNLTCLPLLAN